MSDRLLPMSIPSLGFLSILLLAPEAPSAQRCPSPQEPAPREQDSEAPAKPERTWRAAIGELAPDFTLTDLCGVEFTLSGVRGKVVVLEWFNPDCPIVKGAHAKGGPLHGLGNELHAAEDTVWVAINSSAPDKSGWGLARNTERRAELGITYPILIDEAGWVGRMYAAEKTPQLFVVDATGRLRYAGGHDDGSGHSLIRDAVSAIRAGRAPEKSTTRNFGCNIPYLQGTRIGFSVEDVTFTDLEGAAHQLSEFRGRPLVLEWFNPECPFVRKAHKGGSLDGAAARAAAHGVQWLAVNSAAPNHSSSDPTSNREALETYGLVHPLIMDPLGRLGRLFEAETTPHVFVLDARGVLVYRGGHDNQAGKPLLEAALQEILVGKPVTHPETRPYGCSVKYAPR